MGFDVSFCFASKKELTAVGKAAKANGAVDVLDLLPSANHSWDLDFAMAFLAFVASELSADEDFTENGKDLSASLRTWRMPEDMVEELAAIDDEETRELVEAAVKKGFADPAASIAFLKALAKRAEAERRGVYVLLDTR
jgi:hypothetical protein